MTGIATKPWLSGNMLQNIKTYENGWLNFSENLRLVSIKLLHSSQFALQICQFTLSLNGVGIRCDRGGFRAYSRPLHSWPGCQQSKVQLIIIFSINLRLHQYFGIQDTLLSLNPSGLYFVHSCLECRGPCHIPFIVKSMIEYMLTILILH